MAGILILVFISLQLLVTAAVDDEATLLSFASGVSVDPDRALANWGSPETPVCNWTGVACDRTGHVVQLDLSKRNLTGVISPVLSNLSFLSVLDLSENSFHGRIPSELGALSRLTQLSLSSNLLEGSMPYQLGFLRGLIYVDLGGNRLDGLIPKALFCNTSLQYADLSSNSLRGEIPLDNECSLLKLRYLLLWSNNLGGPIPRSLSNSSKLQWMDLGSNFLTGGLPSDVFHKMPNLQILYLSYNNLSVHSVNHSLDPLFVSLANCTHLQELQLAGNGLGAELPSSIGHLSQNLLELHLEENKLQGSIPPEIINLVNLTYLNLSINLLNGSIPPHISRMRKLERLYLSRNFLSGEIPPSLGEIPHLGLLDLSGNLLSGQIPDTLSNLSQLRMLMLHNNQLNGTISSSLGNCMNLEGSLPLGLSKMVMILALDLSSNNLSGTIHSQLGSCVALEYLNLSGNALHGDLPGSIGSLPYLKALDLSSNQLSGALPDSLRDSSTLKTLNFAFNNFSGPILNEGVFTTLSFASFRGNPGLCGTILGMPSCSSKQNHLYVILPIIITILGTSCLLCLFGYRQAWKFRARIRSHFFFRTILHDPEENLLMQGYPRISYQQLVEATGGFSELNLIGSGQFGKVYKGILHNGTAIAVKVMYPKSVDEFSGSFRRECEVLKVTKHRNLIKIITACSRPDFKALVLPLMSNGSLESHLYPRRPQVVSSIQLVSIASDVAEGMAYLHHYSPVRVIHCDLKPTNVLLDNNMTALISDFGIARLVKNDLDQDIDDRGFSPFHSTNEFLCGSLGYIAPEYGLGGQPTVQGDVYSFGVLLLEIVTGKRPTDVFHEGFTSLHEWVKSHHPHGNHLVIACTHPSDLKTMMIYLIDLGLQCTHESPSMRPNMIDVAREIAVIKRDLSRHAILTVKCSSVPVPSF